MGRLRRKSASLNEITDLMNQNLYKLLKRGDNLNDIIKKSQSLEDSGYLFKKSSKMLCGTTDADYRTENNDTSINEYIHQLLEFINEGKYQYALDKAAQLGLIDIVNKVLYISKEHPLNLDISLALKSASFTGHLEVVEALINNDLENERNYNRQPRPSITPLWPFYEGQKSVKYRNISLTIENLKTAILEAVLSNHLEIKVLLEKYYFRMCVFKGGKDCI
jgi:hypothetical protein